MGVRPVKLRLLWRALGVVCLLGCLLMVVLSGTLLHAGMSRVLLIIYWLLFVALIMVALYCAMLDLRYTRLELKVRERALFHETFMTDEFRQVMEDAKKKAAEEERPNAP